MNLVVVVGREKRKFRKGQAVYVNNNYSKNLDFDFFGNVITLWFTSKPFYGEVYQT
jgi:hypothetical protein